MPADIPPLIHTTGDALFELGDEGKPLIEGILWDRDVVMMLGSEKAGKSILSMQMAFSLTSGEPFLDKYAIVEKVPIIYVQTEGKRSDFTRRLIAMSNGTPIDRTLFHHCYRKFFPLEAEGSIAILDAMMKKLSPTPRVMYLDSLYTSMEGDLIDNKEVRRFFSVISPFLDKWKLTLVIIHHESKESFDMERREYIDRGDKGSYGSVFLRAFVEHILFLKKGRDKVRVFSCDTQRSGNVMDKEELILIEPDPLTFQLKGDHTPATELIRSHLFKTSPLTREILAERTLLSQSALSNGLRILLKEKIICKSNTRPTLYAVYGHTF